MGETIRYEYDESSNLTQRISPNGAKRIYTFDDDNRLTKEEHYLPKATTASKTMTYEYDLRGLLTGYDDGLTSGVYLYNLKGEKESETITFGRGQNAFSKTLTRTYEANGLLKSLTYPGTIGSNQYTYDSNNQLKTYQIPGLAANNNTLTYQYRWNAIKEITMPGNLKRTVTLDPLQRPERIFVKSTNPSVAPIMDHRYQYDEVSNIKKKTTLDGDYVYGYDELDRLTAATPPLALQQSASNPDGLPVEAYSYDPVHNRMSSAHQPGPWVYNANNELSEWGLEGEKRVLTYDENGSTVKEELGGSQITDYVYDAQDRLIEVKRNNSVVAKYAYDPMGRRIWREAQESVTWFLYSDEGLIQEISGANQAIRTYGWNPDGMWGTDTVSQNDVNGTFMTHNDHLYTTDVLTNATNSNKAWGAIRESFGKTAVQSGNQTEYLMRFPGQWEDLVLGKKYNRFRDYLSLSGNYSSRDPQGLIQRLNVYSYSGANPLRNFDRLGLCFSEASANNNCHLFNFGKYYFRKSGLKSDAVDMDSIGMLELLKHGQIGRLENDAFGRFNRKLKHGLLSQCKGVDCAKDGNVNYTFDLGKGFDQNFDVTFEGDCQFLLGRSRLFVKGYCFGTLDCDRFNRDSGYNGFCYANFYINDRYEDACDVANVIPGNQDFGTPFRMTASWHSFRSFP